jgi:transposase-like protein
MGRLDRDTELAIVAEYRDWDPATCSSEDLARRFGTSRQTMYRVLRKHGVVLRQAEHLAVPPAPQAESTVQVLLARVEELVRENAELRRRLGE